MKIITCFILLFLLVSSVGQSQIKISNLIGEWTIDNHDSLYYKADTLKLIQDANFQIGLETCHLIKWYIEKNKFQAVKVFTCSEPGRISNFPGKEKLILSYEKGKQIITIKARSPLSDNFIVLDYQEKEINRYPWAIKTLKLKRIKNKSG